MEFLGDWGYIGLFLGTFLAATIVPFSSEFILIGVMLTGYNPIVSGVVATSGNWLGGLTSYYIGWLGKWEWIEKWFGVSKEKLERQKDKVSRFGAWLALLTWAPFIGDVFAIGLGFYRIDFVKSSIYMFVGKGLRFGFWIVLYMVYGQRFLDFIAGLL